MALNTAEITAQDKLSFNNSAVSDREDRLISFLEGGNGDIRIRYRINEYLQTTYGLNPDQIIQLNRRLSLKDKISYISSLTRESSHCIVNGIEKDVLSSSDFSESSILRNAALNVFECKLSSEQKFMLRRCVNNLKNFCLSRQLTDMANSLDFHDESDAQKIEKMKEVVEIIEKKGVNMESFSNEGFNTLVLALKPLENLDASYKNLMVSISQVQEVAGHCFNDISTLSRAQIDKLNCVLKEADIKPADIVNNFFKSEDGENRQYLQLRLDDIGVINQDFLVKNKISQVEFEKYFLVHFSREIVEQAKLRFDKQKVNTFRHRSKLYDQEVNEWRGKARERIMELGEVNSGENNEMLDSYFEKFQSVFYGDRNSVGIMGNMYRGVVDRITGYEEPAQTDDMRGVLQGILGRRYGNLDEHNRGLNSLWTRGDLDRVTDVILNQNWTVNQMFYSDSNPFVNEEGFGQRFTKIIGRTETYMNQVKENAMPAVNTTLRTIEESTKYAWTGTVWASKFALAGIAGVGKFATKVISVPTSGFNTFIEKKAEGGFVRKNFTRLLKVSGVFWPITKVLEKTATITHTGLDKTENLIKTGIEKTDKGAENLYKKSIELIRNSAGDKDINHMFQGLTYGLDGLFGLAGKSTSWVGNKAYDQLNTSQKREILARVYEAAGSEEELSRWMATGDLGNKIDLRNYGIHLFNEDGRQDNLYSDDTEKDLLGDNYESIVKIGANAELAVKTYEDSKISTLEEITIAEGLKEAADKAILEVGNTSLKEDLELRISAKEAKIVAAKEKFEREIETAETNVLAYQEALIDTLEQIVIAEGLKEQATVSVLGISDITKRPAFDTRINNKTTAITNSKEKLEKEITTAETNVSAYQNTPIETLIQITTAENLRNPATASVLGISDITKRPAFDTRINNKTTAITAARTMLEDIKTRTEFLNNFVLNYADFGSLNEKLISATDNVTSILAEPELVPAVGNKYIFDSVGGNSMAVIIKGLPYTGETTYVVDFIYLKPTGERKVELNQKMEIKEDKIEFPERIADSSRYPFFKPNKITYIK